MLCTDLGIGSTPEREMELQDTLVSLEKSMTTIAAVILDLLGTTSLLQAGTSRPNST